MEIEISVEVKKDQILEEWFGLENVVKTQTNSIRFLIKLRNQNSEFPRIGDHSFECKQLCQKVPKMSPICVKFGLNIFE
jgi:hypothetical protein